MRMKRLATLILLVIILGLAIFCVNFFQEELQSGFLSLSPTTQVQLVKPLFLEDRLLLDSLKERGEGEEGEREKEREREEKAPKKPKVVLVIETLQPSPTSQLLRLIEEIGSSKKASTSSWQIILLCIEPCNVNNYIQLQENNYNLEILTPYDHRLDGLATAKLLRSCLEEHQDEPPQQGRCSPKNTGYLVAMASNAHYIIDGEDTMTSLPSTLYETMKERDSRLESNGRQPPQYLHPGTCSPSDPHSPTSTCFSSYIPRATHLQIAPSNDPGDEYSSNIYNLRKVEDFELYSLSSSSSSSTTEEDQKKQEQPPPIPTKATDTTVFKRRRAGLASHYNHFGLATMFPRGYPRPTSSITYLPWLSTKRKESLLEVAVQVPILRRHPDLRGNIYANKTWAQANIWPAPMKDPIAFERGTFGCVNSNQVIFHKSSFFGLFLPNHVSVTLSDVWRGFVLQRILWDYGKHVSFYSSYSQRNINLYSSEVLDSQYDDTKFDLEGVFEPLLDFLVNWEPGVASEGPLGDFDALYQQLIKTSLVPAKETEFLKAWVKDFHFLVSPTVSPSSTSPSSTSTPIKSPSTSLNLQKWKWESELTGEIRRRHSVSTVSQELTGKVTSIWGTQTNLPEIQPSWTKLPLGSALLVLNWQSPVPDMTFVELKWSEGRNFLLQLMYSYERFLGYKIEYFVFMDDDVHIVCVPTSATGSLLKEEEFRTNHHDLDVAAKCWNFMWSIVKKWEFSMTTPPLPGKEDIVPRNLMGVRDAILAIFHREAVEIVLPYDPSFENVSWWLSQLILNWLARVVFPYDSNHLPSLYVENSANSAYPAGLMPDKLLGPWVLGEVPPTAAQHGNSMVGKTKNRKYDDMCSVPGWCDIPEFQWEGGPPPPILIEGDTSPF